MRTTPSVTPQQENVCVVSATWGPGKDVGLCKPNLDNSLDLCSETLSHAAPIDVNVKHPCIRQYDL